MIATAAPDVIDALVEIAEEALHGVQVVDAYATPSAPAQLIIGGGPPDEPEGGPYWSSRRESLGGGQYEEFITISCVFISPQKKTPKAARDYLLEQLAVFDAAIRADETLGIELTACHLGALQPYETRGPSGEQIDLVFTVEARTHI